MIETLVDGLDHPEGVCCDPGAEVLWAGGEAGQIYRVQIDAREAQEVADLHTGELEEITRLEGTVPDGVALTDDGGVLVSCYRPDRIVHFDAAGRVEIVAEDPQGTLLAAPTNVAFAGGELDHLVCANLGRWHLSLVDAKLRGVPLHYPDRWGADA